MLRELMIQQSTSSKFFKSSRVTAESFPPPTGTRYPPSRVFGIVGICPVVVLEDQGFEKLKEDVIAYMEWAHPDKNITFKVMSRRVRKNWPVDSQSMNAKLGEAVLNAFPEIRVDVHKPEVMLHVEVRDLIYIYSQIIPGPGGMPVGTNGKAM